MIMSHSFVKQPSEIFPISIDFSRRLASGETISSVTVGAIIVSTSADATATVISSSAINDTAIDITVKSGTDGAVYTITIKITSSSANVFEDEITMTVIES